MKLGGILHTEYNLSPWSSLFLNTLWKSEEKYIPKVMLFILGVLPRIKLSERSCHFWSTFKQVWSYRRAHLIPLQSVKSCKACNTCRSASLQKLHAPGLKSFKPCIAEACGKLRHTSTKLEAIMNSQLPSGGGFLCQGNNSMNDSPEWMFAVEFLLSYYYHNY